MGVDLTGEMICVWKTGYKQRVGVSRQDTPDETKIEGAIQGSKSVTDLARLEVTMMSETR